MKMTPAAALALLLLSVCAAAADGRFDVWSTRCSGAGAAIECAITSQAAASGARAMRATIVRGADKTAAAALVLTLIEPKSPAARPRIALVVDGGPPLRLASGSDVASGPSPEAGAIDLRLSAAATRRLLPFLRRGRSLEVTVTGEAGEPIAAALPLPGFAAAVADVDHAQGRTGRKDALTVLIGGATPAAISGRLRDVGRDAVPETLRKAMVARDCPVWDQSETNPSFLAEESFAADLGGGRTLWAIVCDAGFYNAHFALFEEDPSKATDRFEPLLFATFVESIGWTGVDTLANVAYDPETRELRAFDKGRGQGDCGQFGLWEWVGAAFRMVEYRAKEECDGVGEADSFPIVFRGER